MSRHKLLQPFVLAGLVTGLVAAAWPATAEAQRGGFGVGFRGPARHSSTVVFVGGYGFLPYDPWYEFGYAYQAPYYAPYGYDPYRNAATALRIEVKPKQAEVFVDGYRAGVVDDFDGIFQRLYLPPGNHQITLYLVGYRTWSENMYLQPGSSQKLQFDLAPLQPGEGNGPRPVPLAPQVQAQAQPQNPRMRMMPPVQIPGGAPPPGPPLPPPPPDQPPVAVVPAPMTPPAAVDPATAGSLSLRVQPGNADVYIDGQRWQSLGDGDQLVIQLNEGKHQIEIRKPGYQRFTTDVDIKRGETTPLNISLKR